MEVYKLRHKPTGLFYQPVKGRWSKDKSNLGTRGKLYETHQYPKDLHTGGVNISDTLIKKFNITKININRFGNYLITNKKDWEIVVYNLTEVKQLKLV
tara:strand:+ start:434 stop:727 length:294 start_codon:yes stop_codon:yes gene_type:complete